MLNQAQRALGSEYGQETDATGLGIIEGIKNKRGVFTEAPESLGIDPNSAAGMAVGFAGELLTPGLPLTKIANVFRGGKAVNAAQKANVFSRAGKGLEQAGKKLPLRILKPSKTQAKAFRESTGMSLEDFLYQNPKLVGTGEQAFDAVGGVIDPIQKQYNALARSGKPVDAYEFGVALLNKADEIQKNDFSIEAKQVADRIRQQAELFIQQADKSGGNIPIDVVTNTKSTTA
jgi:hypothetical protein